MKQGVGGAKAHAGRRKRGGTTMLNSEQRRERDTEGCKTAADTFWFFGSFLPRKRGPLGTFGPRKYRAAGKEKQDMIP